MSLRRVVITGFGVISSLGGNKAEVWHALKSGISGVHFEESFATHGFRCHIAARPKITALDTLDKKTRRFMGETSALVYLAALEAIEDAGLREDEVQSPRTALIVGSGGPSMGVQVEIADTVRERGARRIGPTLVPKIMSSGPSAVLSTLLKTQGASYSITSACSTSAHCIGNAMELIQLGKADRALAGGGEEVDWPMAAAFDAMGAMSSARNDAPQAASRAYDAGRDGFVISGGGSILILEALEVAQARGANILAEIVGYGASADGHDMVAPSGEGAVRCMNQALEQAGHPKIDYINTHGTSTPIGDTTELTAIAQVFGSGDQAPPISSTKSLSGHALGAAGSNEASYCLLMMQNEMAVASAHIENLDEQAAQFDILQENRQGPLTHVLSNSFGFGGTNATLILKKFMAPTPS